MNKKNEIRIHLYIMFELELYEKDIEVENKLRIALHLRHNGIFDELIEICSCRFKHGFIEDMMRVWNKLDVESRATQMKGFSLNIVDRKVLTASKSCVYTCTSLESDIPFAICYGIPCVFAENIIDDIL